VEVMGRDVSVVSSHPAMQAESIRSIISADNTLELRDAIVRFSLKPHKVFLFDVKTEARIPFESAQA